MHPAYVLLYHLQISVAATDLGDPALSAPTTLPIVFTVTDVNDNHPIFDSVLPISVSLSETEPVLQRVIATVRATDADSGLNGAVRYGLLDPNVPFSLDNTTGVLRLSSPLDFELVSSSHPLSNLQPLVLFRQSPFLSLHFLCVSGPTPMCYHSPHARTSDPFATWRRQVQSYQLSIFATDHGQPQLRALQTVNVTVTVIDINEHAPEFLGAANYSCTLSENVPVGTQCAVLSDRGQAVQIEALDRDLSGNTVTLQLVGLGPFALNTSGASGPTRTVGDLRTSGTLDFETAETYRFTLRATDSGSPTRTTETTVDVQVTDVNDNAPVLGQALCVSSSASASSLRWGLKV